MMCDIFSSFHRCAGAGLRLAAVTVSDSREVSVDHLHPGEIFIDVTTSHNNAIGVLGWCVSGLRLAADTVSDS